MWVETGIFVVIFFMRCLSVMFAFLMIIAAFIVVFEWSGDRNTAAHLRAFVFAGIQAVIVAALVTVVFERIFLVRLP